MLFQSKINEMEKIYINRAITNAFWRKAYAFCSTWVWFKWFLLTNNSFNNIFWWFFIKSVVKSIAFVLFTAWTCFSIYVIPSIPIGLDQQLTMATDSHVYKYFKVRIFIYPVFAFYYTKLMINGFTLID